MSVIIKGATMPGTCADCPLFRESAYGFDLCKGKGIGFVAEDAKWLDATRPDWCPLVELPEKHGRLIDADDFASQMKNRQIEAEKWLREAKGRETAIRADAVLSFICEVKLTLDKTHTIVEAEGD